MSTARNRLVAGLGCLALIGACSETSPAAPGAETGTAKKRELGLNSSLPLYWPLGAEFTDLLSDQAPVPWQRAILEQEYDLKLLDTLSSFEDGATGAESDPLKGLERLAVIQPRGVTPSDNVALDDWVRAGGRLLLVLDPLLTGEYDVPLGNPQRPVDSALIPPVVARWGLEVSVTLFESFEDGFFEVPLGTANLPVGHPGTIGIADPDAADCTILARGVAARCSVGAGQVMVLADAAVFETREFAGENGEKVSAVLQFAFD